MSEDVIGEYAGARLDPVLVRVPEGWAEKGPGVCGCGGARFLVGWRACGCASGLLAPGHRTWRCGCCGAVRVLGCVGRVGDGPMAEYGCR